MDKAKAKAKEIDWVFPTMIAVIAIMFYVFALYSLSEVKKERNIALTIVGQLSMSYEQHLYVEYARTICGIEPVILKGVTTFNVPGAKDSACMSGIREKAKEEVARLMLIKK